MLHWIEANGRVDHGPDGTPLSFPGVLLDIEDRRAAQEALRESEAHWRGLFERLNEGFLVGEVVRDEASRITDWRYVDVNARLGRAHRLQAEGRHRADDPRGAAGVEDEWIDEFAAVCRDRPRRDLHRRVGSLRRWYEGRAFPLGQERFGVIFLEVTARVEADVRRDALLELGERLRDAADVPNLVEAAADILARATDATRAGYGLVDPVRETVEVMTDWHAPGTMSVAGLHGFRAYGSYIEDLKRGEVVAIDDVALEPPDTRHRGGAAGHRHTRPAERADPGAWPARGHRIRKLADHHPFTADDLAFVRTVADRVQSAVARLQAEAEQRVLNEEISHRLKNTFAMVISIATQTLRTVPERAPVEAFISPHPCALVRPRRAAAAELGRGFGEGGHAGRAGQRRA